MPSFYQIKTSQSFFDKVREINLALVCLLVITFFIGLLSLYSVADASFDPWARNHLIRFIVSLVLFLIVCLLDIKIILKLAYPLFFLNILALILIIFIGTETYGATDGIMETVEGLNRTSKDWTWNNPKAAAIEFESQNKNFKIVEPKFPFNEGLINERVTYWPSCYLKKIK